MIAWKERMKDGRHVGLDFYDLLIEPIWNDIAARRCHPFVLESGDYTVADFRSTWRDSDSRDANKAR